MKSNALKMLAVLATVAIESPAASVTNAAGVVMSGEIVRSTMTHVFLRRGDGSVAAVPYGALAQAERGRVERLAGVYRAPAAVADILNRHRLETERIDALERSGEISAAAASDRRAEEREAAAEALRRRSREIGGFPAEAAEYLIERNFR